MNLAFSAGTGLMMLLRLITAGSTWRVPLLWDHLTGTIQARIKQLVQSMCFSAAALCMTVVASLRDVGV
jgi:hypothetical protein